MPMMNQKNTAISASAVDLIGSGVDENLTAQLKALEDERKKKLMGTGRQTMPGLYGDSVMGMAATSLLG